VCPPLVRLVLATGSHPFLHRRSATSHSVWYTTLLNLAETKRPQRIPVNQRRWHKDDTRQDGPVYADGDLIGSNRLAER